MEISDEDLLAQDPKEVLSPENERWKWLHEERMFYESQLGHPTICWKTSPTEETPKYNPFSGSQENQWKEKILEDLTDSEEEDDPFSDMNKLFDILNKDASPLLDIDDKHLENLKINGDSIMAVDTSLYDSFFTQDLIDQEILSCMEGMDLDTHVCENDTAETTATPRNIEHFDTNKDYDNERWLHNQWETFKCYNIEDYDYQMWRR